MMIVSQNKDFAVNYRYVHLIGAYKVNKEYHINFVTRNGKGTLGRYSTWERAKEVLQKILKFSETTFTYVMPER